MVAITKGKTVAMVVSLLLVELAKPPVKVATGLVKGLLPEFCPDNELLVKQFCSN